jgi:hypothetical protein
MDKRLTRQMILNNRRARNIQTMRRAAGNVVTNLGYNPKGRTRPAMVPVVSSYQPRVQQKIIPPLVKQRVPQ